MRSLSLDLNFRLVTVLVPSVPAKLLKLLLFLTMIINLLLVLVLRKLSLVPLILNSLRVKKLKPLPNLNFKILHLSFRLFCLY